MARRLITQKVIVGLLIVITCGLIRLYTLPPAKPKLDANIYKTFSFIQPIGTEYCPDLFKYEPVMLPKPSGYEKVLDDFFEAVKALAPQENYDYLHTEEAKII